MEATTSVAQTVGIAPACRALGVQRATLYRWHRPPSSLPGRSPVPEPAQERTSPSALAETERQAVLEVPHAPRFVDAAPAQVYATLLDEGAYLASERTTYRILAQEGETAERHN